MWRSDYEQIDVTVETNRGLNAGYFNTHYEYADNIADPRSLNHRRSQRFSERGLQAGAPFESNPGRTKNWDLLKENGLSTGDAEAVILRKPGTMASGRAQTRVVDNDGSGPASQTGFQFVKFW